MFPVQLQRLHEHLQILEYPKIHSFIDVYDGGEISLKHFECMAEILFWLTEFFCQSYPKASQLNFVIGQEQDRVIFVNNVVKEISACGNIQLDARKLYRADLCALEELNKLASCLCWASSQIDVDKFDEQYDNDDHNSSVSRNFHDDIEKNYLRDLAVLANCINQNGVKISQKISHEQSLLFDDIEKNNRILEDFSIVSSLESPMHPYADGIQNNITTLLESILGDINRLKKKCLDLKIQQNDMHDSIERSKAELKSKQKQLQTLQSADPVFKEEYTQAESELIKEYQIYLSNYKTVCFLKKELQDHSLADDDPDQNYVSESIEETKITNDVNNLSHSHHAKEQYHDHYLDNGDQQYNGISSIHTKNPSNKISNDNVKVKAMNTLFHGRVSTSSNSSSISTSEGDSGESFIDVLEGDDHPFTLEENSDDDF